MIIAGLKPSKNRAELAILPIKGGRSKSRQARGIGEIGRVRQVVADLGANIKTLQGLFAAKGSAGGDGLTSAAKTADESMRQVGNVRALNFIKELGRLFEELNSGPASSPGPLALRIAVSVRLTRSIFEYFL